MRILFFCIIFLLIQSCSIRYVDKKTNTTHLWGVGHLKAKIVVADNSSAHVTSVESIGFNTSIGNPCSISLGYDKYEILKIYDPLSNIYLLIPDNNLFNIKLNGNE
jgi:hypothetical protein